MNLDELERLLREATAGPWIEMEGHPYLFANPRGPKPWHHDIVGRFDYHSDANRALIAALRNSAEELIRDARRYRWLRENGEEAIGKDRGCGPSWTYCEELDAFVDAAILRESTLCQRVGMTGHPCRLVPPCPDCGRCLVDVPEGS